MHLPPREFDKLLIYMVAEMALKRRDQELKLNHSKAVASGLATFCVPDSAIVNSAGPFL